MKTDGEEYTEGEHEIIQREEIRRDRDSWLKVSKVNSNVIGQTCIFQNEFLWFISKEYTILQKVC